MTLYPVFDDRALIAILDSEEEADRWLDEGIPYVGIRIERWEVGEYRALTQKPEWYGSSI
jgi:hypothetical protein